MSTTTVETCPECRHELRDEGSCYRCEQRKGKLSKGLRWCRLTPFPSVQFEKQWSPLAMIGPVEISYGHSYYWITKGPVPLAIAKILYADPVGKDLIRVAGHCGCPPPEAPWVNWRMPDGQEVISTQNKTECESYLTGTSEHLKKIAKEILETKLFSDDPASLGANGFVNMYHIDGDLGLRVFVDILRANGFD